MLPPSSGSKNKLNKKPALNRQQAQLYDYVDGRNMFL
jgi:hypothetical protein